MGQPTTLLGAIRALFESDGKLTSDFAASGGLWVGGIPEDENALPLIALTNHSEKPSWTFEPGITQADGSFDLVIYGTDLDAVEALARDVMAVFDPDNVTGNFRELSYAKVTSAWIERQDYRVALVDYKSASGAWAYEATLSYQTFATVQG